MRCALLHLQVFHALCQHVVQVYSRWRDVIEVLIPCQHLIAHPPSKLYEVWKFLRAPAEIPPTNLDFRGLTLIFVSFSPRSCRSSSVNFFLAFSQGNLENFVGNLEGIFRGFFLTHRTRAQKFRGNFGAFFVRKFVARKKSFVQNSLCRRATLTFLAWPPLQSLAVKKNFFLCKFWAVKNF